MSAGCTELQIARKVRSKRDCAKYCAPCSTTHTAQAVLERGLYITRWEWKCWRGCVYLKASSSPLCRKNNKGIHSHPVASMKVSRRYHPSTSAHLADALPSTCTHLLAIREPLIPLLNINHHHEPISERFCAFTVKCTVNLTSQNLSERGGDVYKAQYTCYDLRSWHQG